MVRAYEFVIEADMSDEHSDWSRLVVTGDDKWAIIYEHYRKLYINVIKKSKNLTIPPNEIYTTQEISNYATSIYRTRSDFKKAKFQTNIQFYDILVELDDYFNFRS